VDRRRVHNAVSRGPCAGLGKQDVVGKRVGKDVKTAGEARVVLYRTSRACVRVRRESRVIIIMR
jgi:hypothetical protein